MTNRSDFFQADLNDDVVVTAIAEEFGRQQHTLELIASDTIVSKAVMQSHGSVMTN